MDYREEMTAYVAKICLQGRGRVVTGVVFELEISHYDDLQPEYSD